METITTLIVAAFTASLTLFVRYLISRRTHSGSVRISDAETIFKASESVRNDMADELRACRKERDHYLDRLNICLEGKDHG